MYDIAVQSWLKKYLMEKKETDFYEVRYFRSHGLINRQDTNIAGYHLTGGEFDCENELKAIYEYIERLACRKVPDEEIPGMQKYFLLRNWDLPGQGAALSR